VCCVKSNTSEFDEDTAAAGDNNNVTGSHNKIWSRPQHPWNSGGVYPFIGAFVAFSGLKTQEAPYVNKDSPPTTIFLSFLHGCDQLLVAEPNKYYS
jgi:hypothetical protein